jgi:hypothetical protein
VDNRAIRSGSVDKTAAVDGQRKPCAASDCLIWTQARDLRCRNLRATDHEWQFDNIAGIRIVAARRPYSRFAAGQVELARIIAGTGADRGNPRSAETRATFHAPFEPVGAGQQRGDGKGPVDRHCHDRARCLRQITRRHTVDISPLIVRNRGIDRSGDHCAAVARRAVPQPQIHNAGDRRCRSAVDLIRIEGDRGWTPSISGHGEIVRQASAVGTSRDALCACRIDEIPEASISALR